MKKRIIDVRSAIVVKTLKGEFKIQSVLDVFATFANEDKKTAYVAGLYNCYYRDDRGNLRKTTATTPALSFAAAYQEAL